MSELQILTDFKNKIISFLDELIDLFPSEADLVIMRIFLKDQISITEVMNIFNNHINKDEQKLKKMIQERNEKFFLEHNIFESISKNKVSHFKKIWRSGDLHEEDKKILWKWIDSFVYLSDKYNKHLLQSRLHC